MSRYETRTRTHVPPIVLGHPAAVVAADILYDVVMAKILGWLPSGMFDGRIACEAAIFRRTA